MLSFSLAITGGPLLPLLLLSVYFMFFKMRSFMIAFKSGLSFVGGSDFGPDYFDKEE